MVLKVVCNSLFIVYRFVMVCENVSRLSKVFLKS